MKILEVCWRQQKAKFRLQVCEMLEAFKGFLLSLAVYGRARSFLFGEELGKPKHHEGR